MKIFNLVAAGALALSATAANASTILFPTDGDVNFLTANNFIELGLSLAIFDDSESVGPGAQINSSTGLLQVVLSDGIFNDGGLIDFLGNVGPGGAYQASNQLVLYNFPIHPSNDDFIVGISANGGATWFAETSFVPGPGNTGTMVFGTSVGTVLIDIQQVPVPAAVWLFGSGLLGLVGVARRRA